MKKRLISLLLVFTMLFSLFPATALAAPESGETGNASTANPFTDVKEGDWCYDAVQYARVNGFFNGTTATTFTPNGTMTRGMFVTVLGRMAGVDTDAYKGRSEFSDVPAHMYYAPYVAWAVKHGITNGTGGGKFSPDALINRQQMAAFFVRYFEAFGVDYETGANITTQPADLSKVSAYAQDAVLKLWKQGLLNGDGTNFNPTGNASRAQAATLCMRTDEAVDTWYKEPGVASDRISIDPFTGEAVKPDTTETPSTGGSTGSTSGGGSSTRYYEVKFALGSNQSVDITLPETATYPAGTPINSLPTPVKADTIFLGWYYDAAMTDGVETGDAVDRNMTLYAKVAGESVIPLETPNYVTRTEVAAGTYTFDVIGATNVNSAFKFINVTGGNIEVLCSVSGTKVTATLEEGQTYQVELTDDAAQFKLKGESEAQPASIRYLNILTAKEEVTNAELNSGVKQIPVGDTDLNPKGEMFAGLYQIDESGVAAQNESSGSFTYNGNMTLQVGDTVAITSGNVNLNDVTSTEGDVAYVRITAKDDTTYSYEMAELEDVLFIPDVLPIQSGWDNDSADNQITITAENIAAAMSNVEADSLDVGDFLGFLGAGVTYSENATAASYGEITNYTTDANGDYVITYTDATESAVEGALDVYYTQDREIELTEEEKSQIETDIKNDVQESGYVEEAALYLASVMLESNNLEEIPDMEQVAYSMRTMQASSIHYGNGSVTRAGNGNTVKVSFDKTNMSVGVSANSQLEHLKGKGFDVAVRIPFVVTITGNDGNKVQIKVTAEFEEEVILKQNISTKRHKIGFLKYDYSLNASFEVGNYTGIDFKADIYTADSSNEALTEKLEEIMDRMEEYQNGGTNLNDGTMDSLAEIYQDVMERANDTWIDIIDVKLFETNGNAFLHIFCWQVKGSFVVSANLNVSMGMEFDYTMQKQYNFSVRVKAKTATNQVIDIIEPQYNFNFYVVGTIGIRAGLRLEMYVGLISLKLDKIGIMADVGAYTRLWGYFFYHLEWTQSSGKKTNSAGAMLVEIGIYLEIKFVAQLFNSNKLTWDPTLYSHEWPLWSAGEQQNVYAFSRTNDTKYTLTTTKTLALPGSTYEMKYMNLKDGKTGTVSKDDNGENSFIISFSNPAFAYAPATNTVTVTPTGGSLAEETDMVITWKKAALSFTSTPIQKVIRLSWSDPEGMRYISFDSTGGSAVAQLSGGSGAPITWPANPTKPGYDFAGWYTNSSCTTAYSGSTTQMPTFSEGTKGMTLYAKWTPATVSYTVEHYLEELKELDDSYELKDPYKLADTERKTGTTGTQTSAAAYTVYTGFEEKPIEQQTIAADGSTVVKVYYDRETYTVTFKDGVSDANNITRTYRYGEAIAAPFLAREGYTFNGWSPAVPKTATRSATYTAQWTGNDNTVTFESQDGNEAITKTVKTGENVTEPADPARRGYTFGGWYSDQNGTKEWDFNADTVTGDLVLYAKWTADQYTVTFDANGGTLSDSTKTITFDGVYGELPTPVNTGYNFTGWYTEQAGGEQITAETKVTATENHSLYAHWQEGTVNYTVKHLQQNLADDDYTEVTDDRETLSGVTNATTAAAAKEYTGFTAQEFTQQTIAANGSTVVEIRYDRNKYTITWDQGAGNTLTGSYTQGEVKYGTPIVEPDTPTKDETAEYEYSFSGWTPAVSSTVTDNATYTAVFTETARSYDITYVGVNGATNDNDDTYTYGAGLTLTAPSKTGYTFGGWYDNAEFSGDTVTQITAAQTGDVTLYAKWTANLHIITWHANGGLVEGQETYTQDVEYDEQIVAPDDLTKTAGAQEVCVFIGWNTKVDGSGIPLEDGDTVTVTGDMTYYAQWETHASQYTVTWVFDGGYALDDDYTYGSVNYGEDIIPPTPIRDAVGDTAYSFLGWTTEAVSEEYVEEFGIVEENVTYYAQWRAEPIVHYGLYIGDTEFTSTNLEIEGDEGTAEFDPDTFTLTLDNFSLTAAAPEQGSVGSGLLMYIVSSNNPKNLTIELNGNNRLENTCEAGWGYGSHGICIWGDADVTITGEGSLTCIGGPGTGYDSTEASMSSGICCTYSSTLTVDIDGTLTARGQTADKVYGIFNFDVVVKSGTVQAIAEAADTANDSTYGSYGCYGGIKIYSDAEFTAQGYTQALKAYDLSIVLGNGITAMADTDYNGTNPVEYVKANNDTYKWYHAG